MTMKKMTPLREVQPSQSSVDDAGSGVRTISDVAPHTAQTAASKSRARKLRARRLKPTDLHLGQIFALVEHPAMGQVRCLVEDLSLTGMALVLSPIESSGSLVLTGDRLDRLEVSCPSGTIYTGSANVRRVTERDGNVVLGVEVRSRGIDLAELYRLGTRQSFQERMDAVLGNDSDELPQEYKAWVADLRSYLERASEFLQAEERILDDLDSYGRQQALEAYLETSAPQLVERLNRASQELSELVEEFTDEMHSAGRAYYKAQLLPLLEQSPILRRASVKPLGYAGDYEMMNMLYRDHAEGQSLFARALNLYAAQEAAASAVVNRLDYLTDKIRRAIEVRGRVRVASIGCGPAKELAKLLEESPQLGPFLDVALIDQEERVITYCERTLGPLVNSTGARIRFIRESVRRLLTTDGLHEALGERDLVYSAGLFDYLDGRSFSALLSVLYGTLAPTGQLIIGNYSVDNPSRYFMEYCLDWFLIHRTHDDLRAFVHQLSPAPSRVEVESETLGVNLFLNVWK